MSEKTELQRTIEEQADQLELVLGIDVVEAVTRLEDTERIWLVGTGTSQHAAELGAWMLASSGRETHARSAASFAALRPPLDQRDGLIVLSHTGETAFALRARAEGLAAGAQVVSIAAQGVPWPEAIETVPREQSETYTSSYLAALVVLAQLAVALGAVDINADQLRRLPDAVRSATAANPVLDAPPDRLLVIAGAGPGAVTAREGALKLREAARVAAEGYEGEYLLHGSAVPLGSRDALVLLAPAADPDGLLAAIGAAASADGVTVKSIDESTGLPPVLAQIQLTVFLQVMASRMASKAGHDPDSVIDSAWADSQLWRLGATLRGAD